MSARACRRCGQEFKPSREFHKLCWDCYGATHADAGPELQTNATPFDAAELRWILQRVHPDKNDNSEIANEVTKRLLRMRLEARS